MRYIVFAFATLLAASWLLVKQYRRGKGTTNHVWRGIAMTVLALMALISLEYALLSGTLIVIGYPVLRWIHLPLAVSMLVLLALTVGSGIVFYWQRNTYAPLPGGICKALKSERLHRFLVSRYPWRLHWFATLATGILYLHAALVDW